MTMTVLAWVLAALAAVYLLILTVRLWRQGRFWLSLLITAGSGIAALVLLNLLAGFTGVSLAVNGWTVGTAASMGVPGLAAMLVIRMFF